MKKIKTTFFIIPALLLTTVLLSCGEDESASSTSAWLGALANGLAVASPTAVSTRSDALNAFRAAPISGTEPLAVKATAIEAVAKGTATDGCNATLPSLPNFGQNANCYGPTVAYTGHPDGTPTSGNLPGGDTGLWEASVGSTACAAAQLDKLIATASAYVDAAMLMEATAICSLNKAGTAFPSTGTTLDITTTFSAALTNKNTSATVTSATATAVDATTTKFVFKGTTDGAKGFSVTFAIKKTSDTVYQGRIHGYFQQFNKEAFVVKFDRSSNDIKVEMYAGAWNTSKADSEIFDSNNEMIMTDTWQGNMNHAIINMNASTGVGTASFAWQAGSGDDSTRTFNVYTTSSGGLVSGCGFFGFGSDFSNTLTNNTNTISKFVCNWAGPSNNHTGQAGKAQKQCFAQATAGGAMAEVTAKRAINYAPANNCNDSATSFTYTTPAHYTNGTDGSPMTNNLVTLSGDTDFSSYTAPTGPTLASGL